MPNRHGHAVIMESDQPFGERTGDLYRQLIPRMAFDLLAYTPEEWLRVKERSFIRQAIAEGRMLYETSGG